MTPVNTRKAPAHHSGRTRTIRRRAAALGIAAVTALGIGGAGIGTAAAAPSLPSLPSAGDIALPGPDEINDMVRDGVLDAHDAALLQAGKVPEQFRDAYEKGVRDLADLVAPGAVQERQDARDAAERAAAAARAEREARAAAAQRRASTDNTPCPASARVCVDIDGKRTWLQRGGETSYGPVSMSPGKPGQDTPRGNFTVQYKVKDEISREFNNAPMPYAVYFTNNGHAFHQGTLDTQSAGCVRLNNQDAVTYFNALNPGDQVFIY
jgi:lipoprotein-anchoring transpeptidase ErfK/SrfK